MNWIAMPIALILLVMVAYHIYQRHFVQALPGVSYQFDDLPALNTAPVTADIKVIVSRHIFGVIPQAPAKVAEVIVKEPPKLIPKTRLNIKLSGIIDGDTPEQGIATLEVDRGRTLVVAVGEKIGKTDAVLHQVLPGEVLVDRDGTIESVKMVRKSLSIVSLDPSLFDNLPQPSANSLAPGKQGNLPTSTKNYQDQIKTVPESSTNAVPSGASKRFPVSTARKLRNLSGQGTSGSRALQIPGSNN